MAGVGPRLPCWDQRASRPPRRGWPSSPAAAVGRRLGRAATEKQFSQPLLRRETGREAGPGLRNKGVAMVTRKETHSGRRGKGVKSRPPSQDKRKASCHGDAHSFPRRPGPSPTQGPRNPPPFTFPSLTSP